MATANDRAFFGRSLAPLKLRTMPLEHAAASRYANEDCPRLITAAITFPRQTHGPTNPLHINIYSCSNVSLWYEMKREEGNKNPNYER